jgi:branched-chain amino acid transport system ATP-binding protein
MSNILEVINATKRFGGLSANENITFSIKEGEIVGLVGPNGAGKTTLFNSISGAHSLTSGHVIFEGMDITKKKPFEICKLGIGRTFQIPQALNEMTVFENVLVGALNRHSSVGEAKEHTQRVIAMCGLAAFLYMNAGDLNVMQKKRLEIARALATSPRLLLLDETMAGLTGVERKEAINLIKRIRISGITVLMIEHVMEVVMNVSDRVVVLTSGKLLVEGTPDEVTRNQQVIHAYLGGGTI